MGGLFLDDFVIWIIRIVRRMRRRKQALSWSVCSGTLTRVTTSYGSPTLPLVDYTYQVSGQTQVGSAMGLPIKDDKVNQIGDVMDSLPSLLIRYDPANPERSRILNEVNPQIPFEIDLLAH